MGSYDLYAPAADFDPTKASAADLAKNGFPVMPDDPHQRARYMKVSQSSSQHKINYVEPTLKVNTEKSPWSAHSGRRKRGNGDLRQLVRRSGQGACRAKLQVVAGRLGRAKCGCADRRQMVLLRQLDRHRRRRLGRCVPGGRGMRSLSQRLHHHIEHLSVV